MVNQFKRNNFITFYYVLNRLPENVSISRLVNSLYSFQQLGGRKIKALSVQTDRADE